jgi:hypothetical protein
VSCLHRARPRSKRIKEKNMNTSDIERPAPSNHRLLKRYPSSRMKHTPPPVRRVFPQRAEAA